MTAVQKQADDIVHLMRQSKMDDIRRELETLIKHSIKSPDEHHRLIARIELDGITRVFTQASGITPT